ncbi:hypothetical protein [Segetibacter koreensis]|uniref:hypothetical protein n=1 Tax=Segetibacter koreensis TaxID=398037 RepID=UPI00036C1FC5|nr:hypothetical protein [Segetibacter koreensis]
MLVLPTIIEKKQRQFADFLKEKSATCSRNFLVAVSILYCSSYCVACLYIGISAFQHSNNTFVIHPIAVRPGLYYYKRADSALSPQKTTSPNHISILK